MEILDKLEIAAALGAVQEKLDQDPSLRQAEGHPLKTVEEKLQQNLDEFRADNDGS